MGILPRRSEHLLDIPVQRPQHTDARMHQEVAAFSGADQATGCGLPFRKMLLSLRQLHDVSGSILKRDEMATAGQWYRIIKRSLPAATAAPARSTGGANGGNGAAGTIQVIEHYGS